MKINLPRTTLYGLLTVDTMSIWREDITIFLNSVGFFKLILSLYYHFKWSVFLSCSLCWMYFGFVDYLCFTISYFWNESISNIRICGCNLTNFISASSIGTSDIHYFHEYLVGRSKNKLVGSHDVGFSSKHKVYTNSANGVSSANSLNTYEVWALLNSTKSFFL